jgi:DNA invertase Pin-like site-specific DNA recombinase
MFKAAELGIYKTHTFTDAGISGTENIEDRPQLTAALSVIEPYDYFITYNVSRLARDLPIALIIYKKLQEKKVRFIAVESERVSSAELYMLQALKAQNEREVIVNTTKGALQELKKSNKPAGTIPYGYQRSSHSKQLEVCPKEQKVIKHVLLLHEKSYNLKDIQLFINKKYSSRTGRSIVHPFVKTNFSQS